MKKIFNMQKALSMNRKSVIWILGGFAILYILILYSLGLYFGFYNNIIRFSLNTVIFYIIPLAFLITITEFIREKILFGYLKHKELVTFLLMVIIDIIIGIKIGNYDVNTLNGFLAIVGFVIFVSIANNLLFNYIAIRYGKAPNIVYRLITLLYVYILPISPNINILTHTFIKLLFPYVIYLVLEYAYGKSIVYISKKVKNKNRLINIVLIVVMIVTVMLISCKFKYGILVIGSESMTGTINKGDSIVFEQYKNQKIHKDEIIIFKSDKKIIIHRVIEIKNVNNEQRYYTKGDSNQEEDIGYITDKEIIGIYKFKINKIGYLTLFFNNIFER